jgi:hypothetical protein
MFSLPAAEKNETTGVSAGFSVGLPFVGVSISYQSDIFNISGMTGSIWSSAPSHFEGNCIEILITGNLKKWEGESLYLGTSVSCATYDLFSSEGIQEFWGVIAIPIGITHNFGDSPYWIDFRIAPSLFYYSYSESRAFFSAALVLNRKF